MRDAGLFARKPVEQALAETERSGYRRALGVLDLTGIGVAAVIGAGIFVLLGQAAKGSGATAGAGPSVVLSILLAGVAAVLAALAYAEFASLLPGSGSAYLYAYASLGRLPAFLMGWLILVSYIVGNMTVAIGWSNLFQDAVAGMGQSVEAEPFLTISGARFPVDVPAAAIMFLVTLLCLTKIRESTAVNNVLVGVKLLIVLLVIGLGFFLVDPRNWSPYFAGGPVGLVSGAALIFFAYLGFDTVSATAEEARNPRRDLPIGIVASVGVSAVLYMGMGAVVTGMAPKDEIVYDSPVTSVFRAQGYDWAAAVIAVGAMIALTTVLYAFHIALARVLHAMARDGFLPDRFTRLHPRTGTPWELTLWTGLATILGAAFFPIDSVADMTVLASIFVYVLVAGGVLALKVLRPDLPRRVRIHWIPVSVGILLMLVLAFVGIQKLFIHALFWGIMGVGLALYGFYAHRRAVRFD